MAMPSFKDQVNLKILPIPGEDPEILAMFASGEDQGELGSLVDWITTSVAAERRSYFRLVLGDGTELDYPAIEDLSRRPEFAQWKARA